MTEEQRAARILIVDDDPTNLSFVAYILSSIYDVSTASSAEEAIDLLSSEWFDLVLTDLTMPGASGFELCLAINQRWPETRVLVMSGLIDEDSRTEARQRGASDYLTKPFDPTRLTSAVARALGSEP